LPSRIARTIFFVQDGTITLLHGFIKASSRRPAPHPIKKSI
jgi:hypothetical protein